MNIKLHSTNWCDPCKAVKQFLSDHNIQYENIDWTGKEDKYEFGVFPRIEVNGKIAKGEGNCIALVKLELHIQ